MKIVINNYQAKDKKIVLHLLEELQDYIVGIDPLKRVRRMLGWGNNYLNKLLNKVAKQKGQILLAWDKDQPVGFIAGVVKIQTKTNLLEVKPTKLGVILELFVKEKYRHKKLGTILISKMEAYLKSCGCDGLWVGLFASNFNAHNFYKKYGFVDREVGMLKRIDKIK